MKRRRKLSNIYQHPLWIIGEERGQVAVSLGDGVFILFLGGGVFSLGFGGYEKPMPSVGRKT
jgi:hypothetical protein